MGKGLCESAERISDSIVNGAQAPPDTLATPWQLSHVKSSGILYEDRPHRHG